MAHARNFAGIQHEALRRKIDARFNVLHDSLEEAYYGDRDPVADRFVPGTGWRSGQSKPWRGFDVQATPARSKQLFDLLHGGLWVVYALAFHEENQKEATPIPRGKYDHDLAEDGVTIIGSWVEDARGALRQLRTARPEIFNALKAWATGEGLTVNPDAAD